MTTPTAVEAFLNTLRNLPAMADVFNPWRDMDPAHDENSAAPIIRTGQLRRYLGQRLGTARLVLIAEAAGYQGAKFTGIAMTSERILLGHKPELPATHPIEGGALRTSKRDRHPLGVNEPTATIVWRQMVQHQLPPNEFVLWNAFPYHPHAPGEYLSNRKPTVTELSTAAHVLTEFLNLFPGAQVVAVGGVARDALTAMGLTFPHIRHPVNGGATKFQTQLADVLRRCA